MSYMTGFCAANSNGHTIVMFNYSLLCIHPFQVSTADSSYSLGLAEMATGSALNTRDLLLQILDDINAVYTSYRGDVPNVSSRIIANIKNTMSDRHIVEKNFNQLLEDYRTEILPSVVKDWESISEDERASLSKMHNFFCGMHFMVGLAESAGAVLKSWEDLHLSGSLPSTAESKTESATIQLVRTVCKAVEKHGSEKAGCHGSFRDYLKTQGIEAVPLARFKGNRFNIVFKDGGGVYFLRNHLIKFFGEVHGATNRLLQAVQKDIVNPVYQAGCKALGIISKCVNGPLWRLLESDYSIIEVSKYYQPEA